jgi:hypothetical protein
MIFKRQILTSCFILSSFCIFCQSENYVEETRKIHFIIEPCILSGIMNTTSDINKYRFKLIPSMNSGIEINNKLSVLLGVDYYKLHKIHYDVDCINYPCPNTTDYEIIDISLYIKYKVFKKNKYSIEPFLNSYNEIIIYQLDYYYDNKENEQWESYQTPYSNTISFSFGAYINYSILNKMNLFIAPTFKLNSYLLSPFAGNFYYLIGGRIGTSYYF